MKKWLLDGAYFLLWLSAACTGLLALACAGKWWENPYVEEDAFALGLFVLALLVLLSCLMAALLWWRRARKEKLVKSKDENTDSQPG